MCSTECSFKNVIFSIVEDNSEEIEPSQESDADTSTETNDTSTKHNTPPHIPRDADDATAKTGGGGDNSDEYDDAEYDAEDDAKPSTPPESAFAKLGPSKNRYTILRDEF